MKLLLLALLVVALIMHIVESKKMWGSRKKREEVEEVVVPPTPKTTIQEVGRGARQGASKRRPSQTSGFASQAPTSGEFEKMFSTYLSSFEELLNSEDFDSMVNPESIRAMLEQFPGAADIPELNMLLNMPEFNDASLLKQTMREGLAMAKESSAEIIALLNDPERMEELMGQLPHEVKQLVEGLRTGDFTALKDFVINLPGNVEMTVCSVVLARSTILLTMLFLFVSCRLGWHSAATNVEPAGREHGRAGGGGAEGAAGRRAGRGRAPAVPGVPRAGRGHGAARGRAAGPR
jgi:hypothetical protein